MPCTFNNINASELADLLVKNKLATAFPTKIKSSEEGLARLNFLTDNFELRDVEGQHKYGVKGFEAQTKESFTTEASKKFEKLKGKKKAEEISNKAENIIKRDAGIMVHAALQDIMLNKLKTKYKGKVLTNTSRESASKDTILKNTGFQERQYSKLDSLAEAVISNIIKVQNKIDPEGKVTISPEQILVKDRNLGGTADIVAIFSNGDFAVYDYKTLTPSPTDVEYLDVDGVYEARITDPSWIAFYHYDDWAMQLPKAISAMKQTLKAGKLIESRIIPIHLDFATNKEKKITSTIKGIRSFADNDYMLDMIPIQEETEDLALNARINQMLALRHNLQKELEDTPKMSDRGHYLKARVDRINVALNKLIVRKDVRNIVYDYTTLVSKYGDINDFGALEGLKKGVSDETSPIYLKLEQLLDLYRELNLLQGILSTTSNFYKIAGLEEEEMAEILSLRRKLADNTNSMISSIMEEIVERLNITPGEIKRAMDSPNLNYLSRMTRTFSEIQHPFFQDSFKRISEKKSEVKIETDKIKDRIYELDKELQKWGSTHGLKGLQVYEKLIDSSTGNLYHKLSKEFYERRNEAIDKGDTAWLKEHYQKRKDADELYNSTLESYKKNNNLSENNPLDYNKIEKYKKFISIDRALTDKSRLNLYYELKDEYKNPSTSKGASIHSKEYVEIYREKPLKDFYDYWTEQMKTYRSKLGFSREYERIPDNFLPWMRAEIAEKIFSSGALDVMKESIYNIFNVTNDEAEYGDVYAKGKIAPDTGEILSDVPRWFINPIINKHGEIDKTLKSHDLGKVLYSMAQVAYNYEAMKSIEAEMDAFQLLLEQPEFGLNQQYGNKNIFVRGGNALKFSGKESAAVDLFRKHINYAVYGIKTQTRGEAKNWQKTLKSLNRYEVAVTLGLKPALQVAASLSAKLNQYFEASKGYYFTKSQMGWAEKALIGSTFNTEEGKKVLGAINFFEPYEYTNQQKMKGVGGNWVTKLSAMNVPFLLFRKGSSWINSTVMLAMLKNYGLDAHGRVRRLEVIGKDAKSLYDSIEIEGDSLVIKGLLDKDGKVNIPAYTQLKNLVSSVARGIHGEMSHEDIMAVNMTLFGQLFMTYKSWAPHLIRERIHKMEYEPNKQVITIGRFNALWASTEISKENKEFLTVVGLSVKRAATLMLDIATFGALKNVAGFKTSRDRIEQLYEEFKAGNLDLDIFEDDIENVTKEEFMKYFDGQIRAMVVELRMLLGFISAVAAMGFAFDDDDEDGKLSFSRMNWQQRQMYRLVNRVRRELGFFYGSSYIDIALQNPVPVTNVLVRASKIMNNTWDEAMDAITGRIDKRDKTNVGYYSLRALPYNGFFTSMFEPTSQDKSKQF